MLLAPFQAGLVPVHAKPQPVLVTGRYLTRPQHAAHAALVAEQNVSIVIEHTALDETAEVRRQLAGVQSRDEVDEMIGVGPMSPRQPPAPARRGSTRQPACLCPVSSSLVDSQCCTYSACTTRIVPSSPAATISRACRTRG